MQLRNHMRVLASTAALAAIACPVAHAEQHSHDGGGFPSAAHHGVGSGHQGGSTASSGALDGPRVRFRTVDVPGATGTVINGVTQRGVVLGTDIHGTSIFGFIETDGRPVIFNYPGTSGVTYPGGINDSNVSVGIYSDAAGAAHGWIRSAGGAFSSIDDPSAGTGAGQGTFPDSISNHGVIAGTYIDAGGVSHGFADDRGRFETIDEPEAPTTPGAGTSVFSINDEAVVVGDYVDGIGVYRGFVLSRGRFFGIDAPGAGTAAGQGTEPSAISNTGVIDGETVTSGNVDQGWLLYKGRFAGLNDPQAGTAAGQGTIPLNISSDGSVACGLYLDANGVQHGFVASLGQAR